MDPDDWQPATSRPGEIYTVEGEIRSIGSFFRGLKRDDPRGRSYRRSMQRIGWRIMGIGVAVVVLLILVTAIF